MAYYSELLMVCISLVLRPHSAFFNVFTRKAGEPGIHNLMCKLRVIYVGGYKPQCDIGALFPTQVVVPTSYKSTESIKKLLIATIPDKDRLKVSAVKRG